jgi:hypothetical protein
VTDPDGESCHLGGRKRQRNEFGLVVRSVPFWAPLEREATALERQISDLVNEAYGLTP